MSIFPFITSEYKEPELFFPHIKCEVEEFIPTKIEPKGTPFIPIKIEPEETAFIPIKIEPEETPLIPVKIEPEMMPWIPIKIEPEETALTSVKIEPKEPAFTPIKIEPEGTPLIPVKIEPEMSPWVPIKIEPEEVAFTPVKIEPEDRAPTFIHDIVLKCKMCGDIFFSNEEFNKHAKNKHKMKYSCFNCSEGKITKNFSTAFFLHETILNEYGTTIMKCKACSDTFESGARFRSHARKKHQSMWVCLVCFQVFSNSRTLRKHNRQNHAIPCTLCSKKIHGEFGLRQHFDSKHKPLQQEDPDKLGEPDESEKLIAAGLRSQYLISANLRSKKEEGPKYDEKEHVKNDNMKGKQKARENEVDYMDDSDFFDSDVFDFFD